jgi:hypothetical protein
VKVRSGGFFNDDDPPETPQLPAAMTILLVVVSTIFAVIVLLARVSFSPHGDDPRAWVVAPNAPFRCRGSRPTWGLTAPFVN